MTDQITCPADMKFIVEKQDKRKKKGWRVVETLEVGEEVIDITQTHLDKSYPAPKFRIKSEPVWAVRTNLMSGIQFVERYDTPSYCSPSCESYYTM